MVLNKVKGNMYSFVNFTWNVIKGKCSHDCTYCLCAGTKILMADFSEKNIEDIKIGDKVIGLKDIGKEFNRFQEVLVLDTNKRRGDTIKITTDNGELKCTPEHKIMGSTEKRNYIDWKQAKAYSPYQIIRRVGNFLEINKDWKLGWLSGYIDGEGCFFDHNNGYRDYLGFEAVSNEEDLRICLKKLALDFGIELSDGIKRTSKKSFSKGKNYPLVFTREEEQAKKLKEISLFRLDNNLSFYRGYLAGIIDAEGTVAEYIRISQSKKANPEVFDHIVFSLNKLNFKFVEEKNNLRITGGLDVRLKILFECNPQSLHKKKRLIFGNSVKGSGYSTVESLSKNNEQEVYNLKTESENYIANGFIVHNCYMKRFPQKEIHFDEKELKTDLGEGNFIFVGSSTDMFADNIPRDWIISVLSACRKHNNKYLFQTKNPRRFWQFADYFPINSILGITLESNRDYKISKAPCIDERVQEFKNLPFAKMVTLEPLLDFDVPSFVDKIAQIEPKWVNIGADSNSKKTLPEPSKEKIIQLIEELKKFTKVINKDNLGRLLK